MKKYLLYVSLLAGTTYSAELFAQSKKSSSKLDVPKTATIKLIESKYDYYKERALKIWDYSELGFKETKSTALLQETLKENGFSVESGLAGMPTSFVATYGSGTPVIGILAEFDALPGLSQTTDPIKKAREGNTSGHGCGHHLYGVASVAAGISLKQYMQENKIKGTIKVYGTPAEEGGHGKVYMIRSGLFKNTDLVLRWHPGSANTSSPSTSLALMSVKFRFYGQAAHASASPEKGRSALDGVEAFNHMINMMREHVPSTTRIHYVITEGGKAPNVVPEFAEVNYYARHPRRDILKEVFDRMVKAAEGAALGTGTSMKYEITGGDFELLPNDALSRAMHANLVKVGGVIYTPEEVEYAKKMQLTFAPGKRPNISEAGNIEPYQPIGEGNSSGASTDAGDVSWVVPTVAMTAATWVPGTPGHSWQAVACGGTEIGIKAMIVAAKTIALTGIDVLNSPELVIKAKDEFKKARGEDFIYVPLIGDREPALDYRD